MSSLNGTLRFSLLEKNYNFELDLKSKNNPPKSEIKITLGL